ncbi:cytochrome P450 [Actinophytocola sp.]|uniref:cytochrome P450 n=1 Tax=Actinophytocola sp. TaxID=1872138 RepID=UPI002ED46BBB
MAGVSHPHLPFLNVLDPDFDFNAPEVVEAQERSWCAETPVGLLVLRYADAHALLRDQRLDHNGKRYMEMNGVTEGPIYDWYVPMISNVEGADHRRLRGLVSKAFTPRMIEKLRPFIRTKAEQLTEELASVAECEFIEDFGNPLPLAVMCELLGVPPEDYDTFRVWTADVGLVFSLAHGGDIAARVETAVVGLDGYVDSLMADKKADPGEDLISALVIAQQRDDTGVTLAEIRNLIVTLVFAAHDTTRHQLANAMVAFAGHPDQWRLLGSRPELTDRAVEEVMRWLPSAPTVFRFAAQDFDHDGTHITKNTLVTMCVAAARRDPRVFHDGATFDITATREAPPLQFGAGPHHCLGAALARAEVGEALPVLAGRLGPPVVAGPLTWRPPIGIHGPTALPLRWMS